MTRRDGIPFARAGTTIIRTIEPLCRSHEECKMRIAVRYACLLLASGLASAAAGQKLPTGEYHANRERSFDVIHYRAEIGFDFEQRRVGGKATLTIEPLRTIRTVTLDAILLEVESVVLDGSSTASEAVAEDKSLRVVLPEEKKRGERFSLTVTYSAKPRSGMYFQPDRREAGEAGLASTYVTTYGEGGLHANWLPIYGDVNDKFSTEMLVTVPEPYVAISNGRLVETREENDGRRTYHWLQELPHSGYLISIYVGDFEQGKLEPALSSPKWGRRHSVPQSYWVPRGRLAEGAYAFRNTTRMVDHFSELLDYPYPWDKHDQIAVPDYAIGAMEHTGVTGHNASVLRTADAPVDFSTPDFDHYHTDWSADKTIAHELAHHWFGDNLTCRNLSHLWLNESFASYLMMLWDEELLGRDELDLDADLARRHYFEYVDAEHIIRPLEYHYFDDPETIYNTEHTYLKGAAVLHMLRAVLGDDAFFGALGYYLKKHEYGNVESADLKIAIEESAGKNLGWFFDDWITGGGHPIFEVGYRYLEDLKLVDLEVAQVQALIEGQGLFKLPVEVSVATASGTRSHTVWVEKDRESFLLPAAEKPLMVSFDGRGSLVAEIRFAGKELDELLYQAAHDAVPGRLRALRRLAARFPARPETLRLLDRTISSGGFWGLEAEAALLLGSLRTAAAEQLAKRALGSSDYRVRKAAVLALRHFGTPSAEALLLRTVYTETHSDVVGTAVLALARADPEIDAGIFERQLERDSWWDEIRIAALRALEELGRPELEAAAKPFTGPRWNQDVRQAAFDAWQAADPTDGDLHAALLEAARSPTYTVKKFAVEKLGELYVKGAVPMLEEMVELDYDGDVTVKARQALEEIRRIGGAARTPDSRATNGSATAHP